jgi:hypothetical protein
VAQQLRPPTSTSRPWGPGPALFTGRDSRADKTKSEGVTPGASERERERERERPTATATPPAVEAAGVCRVAFLPILLVVVVSLCFSSG